MGVEINPVTLGPRVNESLETNLEGVFACGNVLHVHDLVDFVSEEAAAAGRSAAAYVKERRQADGEGPKVRTDTDSVKGQEIRLVSDNGVRYTVPETISLERWAQMMSSGKTEEQAGNSKLIVRFRVGSVYKNCYVSAYFGEEQVIHRKRPIVTPGEMEEIRLTREQLLKYPDLTTITVKIEEA